MTISQRVEAILKAVPEARNSDRELIIIYMQKMGMNLSAKQIEIFRDMPSTETIRRTRQALQEQGKYPAKPEVNEARYQKYKNTRANIKHENPEKLLEAQGITVRPWGQG